MNSIVDRDSMHDTWDDWNKELNKAKANFEQLGFTVHEMTIDIDDLNRYCEEKGLKNDGAARSEYTSMLPLTKKKKKWD